MQTPHERVVVLGQDAARLVELGLVLAMDCALACRLLVRRASLCRCESGWYPALARRRPISADRS